MVSRSPVKVSPQRWLCIGHRNSSPSSSLSSVYEALPGVGDCSRGRLAPAGNSRVVMMEEIIGAPDDGVVTATPSRGLLSLCWDGGAASSSKLLSVILRVAGVSHQPYGGLCLLRCGVRGGIVQSRPLLLECCIWTLLPSLASRARTHDHCSSVSADGLRP